jgi:hypothetical protein
MLSCRSLPPTRGSAGGGPGLEGPHRDRVDAVSLRAARANAGVARSHGCRKWLLPGRICTLPPLRGRRPVFDR